jgi:ABC-type taurine transport system substrate-binding protein
VIINRIVWLAAVLVVPQFTMAGKLSFTNDAFGKAESILDFCAQTDEHSAPKYQEAKQALFRDVPEKEVAEARKTQEYKDAYDAMGAELGNVPKDQAIKACKQFLETNK